MRNAGMFPDCASRIQNQKLKYLNILDFALG